MTTLTEFKKLSKNNLTHFLLDNGFNCTNPFMFYRKGNDDIYQVLLFRLSYSKNLKVSALCHTKEMNTLIPRPFPESVSILVGGELEPGEPIAYENSYIWDIEGISDAIKSLNEIQGCILNSAFPFFDSISNRQKLLDYIYPSMNAGEYATVINKIKETIKR
ncbi:MAG: hypothetical protein AB8B66_02400 [Rickettsiaceae bacterium]